MGALQSSQIGVSGNFGVDFEAEAIIKIINTRFCCGAFMENPRIAGEGFPQKGIQTPGVRLLTAEA